MQRDRSSIQENVVLPSRVNYRSFLKQPLNFELSDSHLLYSFCLTIKSLLQELDPCHCHVPLSLQLHHFVHHGGCPLLVELPDLLPHPLHVRQGVPLLPGSVRGGSGWWLRCGGGAGICWSCSGGRGWMGAGAAADAAVGGGGRG